MQFLIPGVLVGNMLFTTLTVGQGLNSDLTKGVFDRLQSLPIARWAPLAGRVIADQFKQLWTILVSLPDRLAARLPVRDGRHPHARRVGADPAVR
nr:hypothetical protein [Salinispora arenicola]